MRIFVFREPLAYTSDVVARDAKRGSPRMRECQLAKPAVVGPSSIARSGARSQTRACANARESASRASCLDSPKSRAISFRISSGARCDGRRAGFDEAQRQRTIRDLWRLDHQNLEGVVAPASVGPDWPRIHERASTIEHRQQFGPRRPRELHHPAPLDASVTCFDGLSKTNGRHSANRRDDHVIWVTFLETRATAVPADAIPDGKGVSGMCAPPRTNTALLAMS